MGFYHGLKLLDFKVWRQREWGQWEEGVVFIIPAPSGQPGQEAQHEDIRQQRWAIHSATAWGYQTREVSYPLSYSMRISDKRGELSTHLYSVQIFTVMQHPKSLSSLITTCNGLSANDGNVNKLSKESVWSSSSKLSRESCTSTSTVLMPKKRKRYFLGLKHMQ